VEFALTIGIVLVLFFAVVDFGRMVAIHAATVTASREAARYGSAVGDSGDGLGTPRYAYCSGIRQAARNVTSSLISLTDAQVAVWYDDGVDTAFRTTADCPPAGTGPVASEIDRLERVVVQVTVTYEAITPIRFIMGPITVVSIDRRTIVKP
jgi:Flp pilus assembly protein TadG